MEYISLCQTRYFSLAAVCILNLKLFAVTQWKAILESHFTSFLQDLTSTSVSHTNLVFGALITWRVWLFLVCERSEQQWWWKVWKTHASAVNPYNSSGLPSIWYLLDFFPKRSRRWWQLVPNCARLLLSYGKWLRRPTGSQRAFTWAKELRLEDDWCAEADSWPCWEAIHPWQTDKPTSLGYGRSPAAPSPRPTRPTLGRSHKACYNCFVVVVVSIFHFNIPD